MLIAHFIDVGQGNMVLLQLDNSQTMLYDCHVTDENGDRVLAYLRGVLPRRRIDIFVNSHREADHMRGIRRIHAAFPIAAMWDGGVPGGDTQSSEYRAYMDLRRTLPCTTVRRRQHAWYGVTRVRILNGECDELPDDPNSQSIVLKIENWHGGRVVNSLILTGDSDARTWKDSIMPEYGTEVGCTILAGGHHGAEDFVRDPSGNLYISHLAAMRPRVTVIPVGDNGYGHPTPFAMLFYELFSTGADRVWGSARAHQKILRTDLHGTLRLQFDNDGSWRITWEGPSPRPAQVLATPDTLRRLLGLTTLSDGGLPAPRPAPGRTLLTGARPDELRRFVPVPPPTLGGLLASLGQAAVGQGVTHPSLADALGPRSTGSVLPRLSGLGLNEIARSTTGTPGPSLVDILARICLPPPQSGK